MDRRQWMGGMALSLVTAGRGDEGYGTLPSARQIAWSQLEYYNFLHFTVNTFTNKEWGEGDEDPAIFNPTAFDADAMVESLKASGSRGVILTCKHHDGFCLWPTTTTEHSVRNSRFRNGKGDVVREVAEAAGRAGLKFGVYLSPWDRNNAAYGKPEYLDIYRAQMTELLTRYGPIFEIWHDGANGGSGFYGGARETRTIDKLHYYQWEKTWQLERKLQPDAAIFSDVGPDVRWVGNEKGIAGETCWATFTPLSPRGGPGSPGDVMEAQSTTGTRHGQFWIPAECDVSIRPGWFYHAKEDSKVRTPRDLLNLYYESVGRGASLLLNVPPDRRGLLAEPDQASLRGFGQMLRATFSPQLMEGAQRLATDGGKTVTLRLPRPVTFDVVRVREDIARGQRVGAFRIEVERQGSWVSFGAGTSIGMGRILHSGQAVTASRLRLQITACDAAPLISELAVFKET